MVRKLVLLLAVGSLLAYSCKKNEGQSSHQANLPVKQWMGHKDDHRPIIIIKIVDENSNVIHNAFIIVTNGVDTLSGYTGTDGIFNADISVLDQWGVNIVANGYFPADTSITTVDSVTNLTRTLILQGN